MAARPYDTAEQDDQAMIRLQAGDESALADISEAWATTLVRFLDSKLRGKDHQLAEELAQDVLIRIWKRRDQYIPTGNFRSWMFTIAIRILVDHARKARRRRALTAATVDGYDPLQSVLDRGADPADVVADAEESECLALLIAELPESQADICLAYYWRDGSLRAIAERRGMPTATAKSRILAARNKLRRWRTGQ